MGSLDLIILIAFVAGAVIGFMNGFVKQLASIIGLFIGLILARILFGAVGEQLASEMGTSRTFGQILAFVLIWLIVPIGISILARVLTKLLEAIRLGFVNRWFGSALGAIKYLLILSMFFNFIEFIDRNESLIERATKETSALYVPLKQFSGVFLPHILKVTNHLIH